MRHDKALGLAGIREFRAHLIGRHVLAESYAKDVDTLLAAYDALAEAVLEFDEASHTVLMPREPYNRMLALARAGRGEKDEGAAPNR